MPVIDGEKWACSSCIKGHRVSGCNHNDRELHHINPKGRPVKQCEHCRGARRSKSHHTKCDCGDRKDKDRQKDKTDTKGAADYCQCQLGAKCVCGFNKDLPDLKVDTSRPSLHEVRTRPKLVTMQSEPHRTVFANGHHRPSHRINNKAHVSGTPYRLSRPHTLHGSATFGASAQANSNNGYSQRSVPATRSMDTLSVSNHQYHTMFGSNSRAMGTPPVTSVTSTTPPPDSLPFHDSLFDSPHSGFRQEAKSPTSNSDLFPTHQWLFDNEWSSPSGSVTQQWSAGDLPLNPSKFSDGLPRPISHSGESKQSGPGLTAASSAHSEMGEPHPFTDLDFTATPSATSESLFWEGSPAPVYGVNHPSTPSEGMIAPTSMPNTQLLEPTFAKNLSAMLTSMTSTMATDPIETSAMAMPTYFEDMIPVDSWPLEQNNSQFGLNSFGMSYQGSWL